MIVVNGKQSDLASTRDDSRLRLVADRADAALIREHRIVVGLGHAEFISKRIASPKALAMLGAIMLSASFGRAWHAIRCGVPFRVSFVFARSPKLCDRFVLIACFAVFRKMWLHLNSYCLSARPRLLQERVATLLNRL